MKEQDIKNMKMNFKNNQKDNSKFHDDNLVYLNKIKEDNFDKNLQK